MAGTPSIGDLIAVSTLLKNFIEDCINAPIEFEMALIDVYSIQYSVDMICIVAGDRKSRWYTDPRLRSGVLGQAELCTRFITRIDDILRRYPGSKMTKAQRIYWMMGDKTKLNDTVGYLDKMVDRFSKYLEMLGYVSPGEVEPLFDQSNDPKTVVNTAIANSRYRDEVTPQEMDSLIKYTRAVSKIQFSTPTAPPSVSSGSSRRRELCMECWTIDTYTRPNQEQGEIGVPVRHGRCQQRLKQMIEEFEDPNFKLPNGAKHARVQHILNHRTALESKPQILWEYVAGRILTYESLDASGVATQTAMVIIRAVDIGYSIAVSRPDIQPPPQLTSVAIKPPQGLLQVPGPSNHTRRFSDPGRVPRISGVTTAVKPPDQLIPSDYPRRSLASSAVSSRATSPGGRKIKLGRRCKWASRCRTVGCKKDHPSDCPEGKRCEVLSCNYRHPTLRDCGKGEACRDVPCNYDHGKIQCSFDPCMDDYCRMKHRAGQKAVSGFWAIIGFEDGSEVG